MRVRIKERKERERERERGREREKERARERYVCVYIYIHTWWMADHGVCVYICINKGESFCKRASCPNDWKLQTLRQRTGNP